MLVSQSAEFGEFGEFGESSDQVAAGFFFATGVFGLTGVFGVTVVLGLTGLAAETVFLLPGSAAVESADGFAVAAPESAGARVAAARLAAARSAAARLAAWASITSPFCWRSESSAVEPNTVATGVSTKAAAPPATIHFVLVRMRSREPRRDEMPGRPR